MKWTNCGMEMVEGTTICQNCGMEMVEGATVCQNCGMQVVMNTPAYYAPAFKLPTERKLWKMIVFGILTLGIYPIVIHMKIVEELNIAASRYDGIRTTNYYIGFLLAVYTLGIYGFWWMHTFSKRVGAEVKRRGYDYNFGASTYWGWNVLGSLIIVGPFIYLYKLMKCMNMINASYNYYG